MLLPVHNISHSRINGPGNRLTIWVQGCKFHCKGCFNPETHSYKDRKLIVVPELAERINNDSNIEGITLSGGEPLNYPQQIIELISRMKKELTIIIYSGYKLDEIKSSPLLMRVVKLSDVSIIGRYNQNLSHPFLGKKFIVSRGRVNLDYFKPQYSLEYTIDAHSITKTGIFKQKLCL